MTKKTTTAKTVVEMYHYIASGKIGAIQNAIFEKK